MQFKDVIGHTEVKKNLIHLFQTHKLPHALLLLGKEGVGGLPVAIALAQYIFCQNRTDTDSCGVCKSCQKISKLIHPDLHLTFPCVGPPPNLSKTLLPQFREFFTQTPYANTFDWLQFIQAENKQGNISASECREIINNLNLTTFEGGYKIQIIWRPEFLGVVGNILLKLIEEPPAHTLLFLVAENEKSILNTILSRTQKILLSPLSSEEIARALMERLHLEEKRAIQIGQIADNNYARALLLAQNSGENDWMPNLRNWFNAIFTGNAIMTSQWVDEMAKTGREQQKNFLAFAQEVLAEVVRISVIRDYHPNIIGEELDFIRKLATKKLPVQVLENMYREITNTIFNIGRNAHSKTQLFYLTLQMQYLLKGRTLRIPS